MPTYKKIVMSALSLGLASTFLLTGCTSKKSDSKPLSRTQFVLGTTATITLYSEQSEATLDEAFNKLSDLEDLLSINKTGTLIDKINDQSGISPVTVDDDTFELIETALHYSELTEGAFDPTIGPLVNLWHIGFSDAKVATQAEIDTVLPLIDHNLVVLDEEAKTVFLPKKGMMLDLGGIGKGYAADKVADLLREKGVKHAVISLGGNVYTLGDKPGGLNWNVGVQDPFNPRGKTIGVLGVINKSLVTSGIYERYLTAEDGTTYHHLLDPDTGYPFDNDIAGVTIISDSSTDGDAISTSAFALGVEKGLAFIESLDNVDAVFITTDKKIYVTSGIHFTLTDNSFSFAS